MSNVIDMKDKKKKKLKDKEPKTVMLESPYNVTEVLSEVRRDEFRYIIRDEMVKPEQGEPFKMTNCYSLDSGSYIGDPKTASFLCEGERLTKLQKADETDEVCTIGFDQARGKWYGWSHRAVCAFGVGDRVFDENFAGPDGDDTPFVRHGAEEIKTMAQAKQAAINFARYVG